MTETVRFHHTDLTLEIAEAANLALASGQIRRYHNGHLPARFAPRMTVCTIHDGEVEVQGYAFCSWDDNFSRRIGRQIAEGRARVRLKAARLVKAWEEQ